MEKFSSGHCCDYSVSLPVDSRFMRVAECSSLSYTTKVSSQHCLAAASILLLACFCCFLDSISHLNNILFLAGKLEKAIFKQVIIIIGSQCIVFTVHTIACRAEKLTYVEAHDIMLWSGMYGSNTMHTKHLLCGRNAQFSFCGRSQLRLSYSKQFTGHQRSCISQF